MTAPTNYPAGPRFGIPLRGTRDRRAKRSVHQEPSCWHPFQTVEEKGIGPIAHVERVAERSRPLRAEQAQQSTDPAPRPGFGAQSGYVRHLHFGRVAVQLTLRTLVSTQEPSV